MKWHLLLIVGLIAIPVALIGVHNAVSAPLPEGFPPPTSAGKIEVKHYPAYRSGTVRYQGQLSQATSAAFEPLYRHISSNDIAMTAPVETRYPPITLDDSSGTGVNQRGEAKISFLYRSTDVQPQQVAQGIEVENTPSMTVVSIGIQGNYNYDSYQKHINQLRDWLARHPEYTVSGSPRRFFYDSPFVPDILKRSEVQIPIRQANS